MGSSFLKFLYVLCALGGLTGVIMVHELGHFAMCKVFGVRTPVFSIGFDPAILEYRHHNTTFQLGAIPIGGYVSINMADLASKPYITKMLIIMGGILSNLLFAAVIFYYLRVKRVAFLQPRLHHADQSEDKPERRIIGPIGIINVISKSAEQGLDVFIYYLALISFNVAIFNLLPIPFFDGGQTLQVTIERFLGASISGDFLHYLQLIFLVLFAGFTIFLLFRDVRQLRSSDQN